MTDAVGSREPIRVLVADDHELFRRGLRIVLEAEGDISVVGEAPDGRAAVAKAAELEPDVVLMDVRMPHMDGIEATRRIRDAFPMSRIIVLTVSDDDDDLLATMKAGANGYLLKEVSIEEVANAVRAVMAGQSLISPPMAARLIAEFGAVPSESERAEASPEPSITDQEREVLRRLALGHSEAEITAALSISAAAVRDHTANVLAKLQARARAPSAVAEGE